MIGILVIGNEILSAQVRDTNLAYMLEHLAKAGQTVLEVRFVRDEMDAIVEALRALHERCHWVFSSGGVGPTHDDVTLPAYAQAFGRNMVRDPELMRRLEQYHGAPLSDAQARMAWVPEGTELVAATPETWPVPKLENCFALPGVPEIFIKKFNAVLALLPPAAPTWYAHVLTSEHEFQFAEFLDALQRQFADLEIGSYPKYTGPYRTKITVKAKDSEKAERCLAALKAHFQAQASLVGEQSVMAYSPQLES